MNFTQFYTILLFIILETWKITCSADFNALELDHLSKKLHPAECMKLLEAMYSQTPSSSLKNEKESPELQNTSQYCRIKLSEWNRTFPGKGNKLARTNLEAGLRTLGRPDLANYVRRSRRLVDILNTVINAQSSEDKSKYHRTRELSSSINRKGRKNKKSFLPAAAHLAIKTHLSPLAISKIEHHNQDLKKHLATPLSQKSEPKEIRLQNFGPMRSEAVGGASGSAKSLDHHHSFVDSYPTRWIAFGIFVLLIVITILMTALIAIYKNQGRLPWESMGKKTCDDRCPLTDHFRKSSDVERGWTTSSTDYMGTRWRRGSSLASSRSPSLICVREKKKRGRRVKRQRDKQQQTTRLEKKRKRKEVKGKKKKRVSKENGKNELSLRERIVNILRKDKPDCKCCKCSFGQDHEGNHQICHDDHCKERRIVNLTDLCSPVTKDSKKTKKSWRSRERKKSKERKDSKDQRRSSPESSPRERRDSRLRETLARMRERSPRWSLDRRDHIEPCTKFTCDARRSPRDRNSVDFDETCQNDHQNQKLKK